MIVEEAGRMEVAVYEVIRDKTETVVAEKSAKVVPTTVTEPMKVTEAFTLPGESGISLPPGMSLQGMDTQQVT